MKKYFLLVLFVLMVQVMLFYKQPESNASDLTTDNILNAVNQERLANNLPALNLDNRLANAAQYKAEDMQSRHYFSHTDPEGNYIWNKIVSEGYTPYLQLGENLAIEFFSTESLMSAWMNSPTHRANILTEGFKDQGMGLNFGQTSNAYGSAIANTFGTLLPVKKSNSAPAYSAQPKLSSPHPPKPQLEPAPNLQTPKTLNPQTPAPDLSINSTTLTHKLTPQSNPPPEALRGEKFTQNFTLPQTSLSNEKTNEKIQVKPSLPTNLPAKTTSAPIKSLVSKANPLKDLANNPILILGGFILFFLLIDLNKAVQNKLAHLDKKINNTVLLILCLLVICFLYWF
jgi:hypothetical protein